jgi:type II secretory pathway pseudopilin PulG
MNFFPHATSATFTKDFSDQKNNPFRPWRPLRESIPTPHAKSAKAATQNSKLHSHFRTLRSSARFTETEQSRAAFSLTEVVIAMGVAAVAFTSIIALFPLGLNMSKESYEATQAALVAQTILADLKDALNTSSGKNQALKLIPKAGNTETFDSGNYTTIDLYNNSSQTFYLAYDQKSRSGATGSPIILRPCAFSSNASAFYTGGATNGANVIVRVIVEKTLVLGAGSRSNPQKIEVSVETPGNAKSTNRVQYVFTGVINQS